jgi:hypothetical protein
VRALETHMCTSFTMQIVSRTASFGLGTILPPTNWTVAPAAGVLRRMLRVIVLVSGLPSIAFYCLI